MVLTLSGVEARLRWGYHPAGTLRTWTVDKEHVLTATVVNVDHFRVSQRPLVFEVSHAKGAWRWPITELQMTDGALTARLGPKEK